MKFIIFIILLLSSFTTMAESETVKVGCVFENGSGTQIHKVFKLKTKSDGNDAIFFSISPDFSKVVEVNNILEELNEIKKGDVAISIVANNSVELSLAMGEVLETFSPRNLGDVMTIGQTSNNSKVEHKAIGSGQLKLGLSLLASGVKAFCQIRNSSFFDSLTP